MVDYDLTRLIIGSEGTLAIITQATLKLTPLAEDKRTLQATYDSLEAAATAIASIMAQPITPCALEFMDGTATSLVKDNAQALLMIEMDGDQFGLDAIAEKVAASASVDVLINIHLANTPKQIKQLWSARKSLSPSLRKIAPKKINEDLVVPVSNIHVNLLVQLDTAKACLADMFALAIALNGNLSGEHSIAGIIKKIKAQFDPANLLKLDKLFSIN